ncbi:MAG: hypothetical protein K5912_04355 [Alphaproteobacteria bacterium]|nr:hypothetical protein [Alphaproteobacteria bacterium]
MNKKLFLTSMLVLGFTGAVFAEPANTSNSFPGDGLMQEDYTYVGQANSTNMADVYEGSVYANAEYTNTPYPVQPGEYLPQSSETVATCTTGNYCPGNQTYYYDTTQDQGLENCPAGYPSSAAGASSMNQCYRGCQNTDVLHASTVTGLVYYGGGTQDCTPTSCVNGYSLTAGTPDLTTVIGITAGSDRGWIGFGLSSSNFEEQTSGHSAEYYGLDVTDYGTFAVDYTGIGRLKGRAVCNTAVGDDNGGTYSNPTVYDSLSNMPDVGTNCYCKVDSFIPDGGVEQSTPSKWVYHSQHSSYSDCAHLNRCANYCAMQLEFASSGAYTNFRNAVFGTIQSGSATCEANTINIIWNGTTQEAIAANEAGTCVYDGDIRTPQSATHVPGKTFTGWRFSSTAPSND